MKITSASKFWKNKKVFITGHTGFKGTWLCIFLNLLGAKIYGYSLKPEKKSLFNQSKCLKILKSNYYGDIGNIKKLHKQLSRSKPDIIFHLAAQPLVSESFKKPIETFQTNIMGTINLIQASKDIKSCKSIVIVTTDKVYKIKSNNKPYDEGDELGGIDPYSASKACSEIVTSSLAKLYNNKKVSTVRSGNVLGGGDYSKNRILPDIISAINDNKILKIRNPNSIRPWQHVVEPLWGYMILAEKQYQNKLITENMAWNFGPNNNSFVKVNAIVRFIERISNLKGIRITKNTIRETMVLKLNSNKSKKFLKWKSIWNLKKTLIMVLEWNQSYKRSNNARKICENQISEYLKMI